MEAKIYEKGFEDKRIGGCKGNWSPWFVSDLICITGGNVSTESKNCLEVTTDDYRKRILIDLEKELLIIFIDGDDQKYQYSTLDYLAFEGFCNKYSLNYEEWSED